MKKVGKTTRPFRYDLNQIPYDYTVEVRNRFKELDLIDRVPDELWMEVRDIVQETGSKTIPKKKKYKKVKWLSEEALQIAVKRREAKSKGGKERYTHLNAEFQRIARRDKKAFLSDQCKEIETLEINTGIYGQLILILAKNAKWEKNELFNKWCWENWIITCKKSKRPICYTKSTQNGLIT